VTEQQADANPDVPVPHQEDLPEQIRIRSEKRVRILSAGQAPYPVEVERSHSLAGVRAAHAALETGASSGEFVAVAGRVMRVRNSGKLCFAMLQDGDGTQLQVMISANGVGAEALALFKSDVDLGDFISVHGEVISSKRGELSVMADRWAMASKALRPLPNQHTEMSEEGRVRQRYVDLIVRPAAREVVRSRATVVRSLRDTFHSHDFVEVETPMLQVQHGGAAARPFRTHMNAFDIDLYLRIAPELFLKRAVVGGIERVFEINRNFRNEGADSTHSPEFAMIEAYQAYGNYDSIAGLTRELVQNAARAVAGGTTVTLADGTEYDLGGEWPKITMFGSLSEAAGRQVTAQTERAELAELAAKHDVPVQPWYGPGKLAEELFEELVVPDLYAPTFVRDYPEDTSPLVAAHRTTPGVTEKWDLYVRSFELGTGYSELVDPVVQRERFVAQARAGAAGDDEAMHLDEDFLRAMEYGMPPTGGMGMGLDRLLMAITGLGIRETILFPLVKPE
jgi:lysyl-tRNA synthetase class 2